VNPDHLFLGTRRENLIDMRAKKRGAKGTDFPQSKLTPKTVLEIRSRYIFRQKGSGISSLAKEYGVNTKTVFRVIKGITWKHILPNKSHCQTP
ncbi:MAG: hypothetical protein WB679_00010, partial [Terracidiphilus sp.]